MTTIFHLNHTQTDFVDGIVVRLVESFTEDVVVRSVQSSLGLFRDRTTYEGQAQGHFHNHIVVDIINGIVAENCLCAIDDSVADIGIVTSDIFGNELAIQKRIAGIG